MTEDNPYRVTPAANADSFPSERTETSPAAIITGWIFVFVVNLPIPVFFGAAVVSGYGGYTGMAVGCIVWCATGILLCRGGWGKHVRATTHGGLLVALSHFYPLLQIYAGMCAIGLMSLLFAPIGGNGPNRLNVVTDSALVDLATATGLTLLTGALLIIVAWFCGLCLTFVIHRLKTLF